jgi:hypothetical protein
MRYGLLITSVFNFFLVISNASKKIEEVPMKANTFRLISFYADIS